MTRNKLITSILALVLFLGCQSTYYAIWEKMGYEKRHLLQEQVEKVRKDQADATEEYQAVVERMKSLYGFDGGELEGAYNALKSDQDDVVSRADGIRERVDKVETIAKDLFAEWETEIGEISNEKFRTQSRQNLNDTKQRYARLEKALKASEVKMDPVLTQLNDYVLFLKHNLNAQAIGSLKQEAASIEVDVDALISDMQQSIREADDFLKNWQ